MTDAGWVAAVTGFVGALLVLVGVPLSERRAAHLERRCPVCQGDMETCRCGTEKPGVPRTAGGVR